METASIVEAQYRELESCVAACRDALEPVGRIADAVLETLVSGGKVLTAGNGGSAADALHMAEELSGRYKNNRRALPGLALCADPTALTCIGNDYGFDALFSRQVEALGAPGDIFVMFTSSGNSSNLLVANQVALKRGLRTVAFLGKDGGKLAGCASMEWIVPCQITARVQEMHTWAMHVVLETVEDHFAS